MDTSKFPVFKNDKKSGFAISEIIEVALKEGNTCCTSIPPSKPNVAYIVDMDHVKPKDLSCDDSGSYCTNSTSYTFVDIDSNGSVHIIRNKQKQADRKYDYKITRYYSYKGDSKRIIYTTRKPNSTLLRYAVVQYIGSNFIPNTFANSKSRPYMRTLPSTIDALKEKAKYRSPKECVVSVEEEYGGILDVSSQQLPRDRAQVYNIKRKIDSVKCRNTGKVADTDITQLLTLMKTDHNIVRNVSLVHDSNNVYPRTFTCPDDMCEMVKRFCQTTSHLKSQLGIDMTYKVGRFYTTTFTFQQPMLLTARKVPPTFMAGFMTSVTKTRNDYKYLAQQLKEHCQLKTLVYGTDGEIALEQGMEDVFPITTGSGNIKLRCFDHMKQNLQSKLESLNVNENEKKKIVTDILGMEFQGHRQKGLVDIDVDVFEEIYGSLKLDWPKAFIEYLEDERKGARSIKETFKICMSAECRTAAGLGDPPNKFDNQSTESFHNVLKDATNHIYVNQCQLLEIAETKIFQAQRNEIAKSIFGQGEYVFSSQFDKNKISEKKWNNMSREQKEAKIKNVFGYSLKNRERYVQNPTISLSLLPKECGVKLSHIPQSILLTLWHDAENILSFTDMKEMSNGDFCLIGNTSVTQVERKGTHNYVCQCDTYRNLCGICKHVLAVADINNNLKPFIEQLKPMEGSHITMPNKAGLKPNKKPRRGRNNATKRAIISTDEMSVQNLNVRKSIPFTEVYHNNNPFNVLYIRNLKSATKSICASCGIQFQANLEKPNDFVLQHRERWEYTCTVEGRLEKKHTVLKTTLKKYCPKRVCVLKRHPYYYNGLLDIGDVTEFGADRLQVLKLEFGYDA